MKFTRKLQKLGAYSYCIVLPKSLIKKFGWRERQKLELSFGGRKENIEIKDWQKKKGVDKK